jgi:hypothetical protein
MIPSDPITFVAWVAVTLIAFVCSMVVSRAVCIRSVFRWACALVIALATWSVLSVYAMVASPRSCRLTITSPPTGIETHGYNIRVVGTVKPHTARVTVAARSESDTRWWIQQIVEPSDSSGIWSLWVNVGTPTAGKGETFELIGLASNDNSAFNVLTGRYLRGGLAVSGTPRWNRSPLIVIRRLD